MLEEFKSENPAQELLNSVRQWMVIREGSADEHNVLRKADITINVSIAASLIKIADTLEKMEKGQSSTLWSRKGA